MFASIRAGKLYAHEGIPSLEEMQAIVGGSIETVTSVASIRANVVVDVYANEEGKMIGLPIRFVRMLDREPLAGDFVIVATNTATGKTIPATEVELDTALETIGQLRIPILNYH